MLIPTQYDTYAYAAHPNVVTSIEFERILSASGPYEGHLVRASDHKEPEKIAWLQCVGSRDVNRCDHSYCSAVCCMYAIKDSMIAKEHAEEDLDCVVFNMDIRTFGKDYEKYYNRAKDAGIRFIKSRIHSIDEVGDTGNLSIRYMDDAGQLQVEEFDMVVLSVGLQVPESTVQLAERLGIELNDSRFAVSHPFAPVETTRPGVYACGVFQEPKDIPRYIEGDLRDAPIPELGVFMRPLLQTLGTDWGREVVGADVWVKAAKKHLNGPQCIVFSDMRFENEYDAVKAAGGECWKVIRPGMGTNGHKSDGRLEHLEFDRLLINDGTFGDFTTKLMEIVMPPRLM